MSSSEKVSGLTTRPAEPRDRCVPEIVTAISPCDITDSPIESTVGTLDKTVVLGRFGWEICCWLMVVGSVIPSPLKMAGPSSALVGWLINFAVTCCAPSVAMDGFWVWDSKPWFDGDWVGIPVCSPEWTASGSIEGSRAVFSEDAVKTLISGDVSGEELPESEFKRALLPNALVGSRSMPTLAFVHPPSP